MKLLSMKQFTLLFFSFLMLFVGCNAQESATKPAEVKGNQSNISGEKMSTNPMIKMETNKGSITIELYADKAPISTENMVNYVKDAFYDGLIFHRVIPGFMIQGGGMNPDMSEKSTKPQIQNEANNGLKNDRGTLAMARTNIPHSASSQFFINLKNNDFLNHSSETTQGWGYAVFGKVTEGMDIVDVIAGVRTGNHGGHGDVPLEAVVIKSMTVIK
jgi:cyclophilin family peptidyl-prolyl cis-trans isomerase